jgi:hypothetical protein
MLSFEPLWHFPGRLMHYPLLSCRLEKALADKSKEIEKSVAMHFIFPSPLYNDQCRRFS